MKIALEIDEELIETFEEIANSQTMSIEQYGKYVLEKYLLREMKNNHIQIFEKAGLDDMKQYITAIKTTEEEIKEKEFIKTNTPEIENP